MDSGSSALNWCNRNQLDGDCIDLLYPPLPDAYMVAQTFDVWARTLNSPMHVHVNKRQVGRNLDPSRLHRVVLHMQDTGFRERVQERTGPHSHRKA
jgi:hypothetical protein